MRKLILGLLMMRQLTAYEIRNIIKRNFQDMCSDSLGSIQAAIKLLLKEEKIIFHEYVEKSVNKKRYAITDKGRNELIEWIKTPADLTASKNMELGKLLFMGLVPESGRLELLDALIEKIETELSGLKMLWEYSQANKTESANQAVMYWNENPEYLDGIVKTTNNPDVLGSALEIGEYQMYTLEFGIANLEFAVNWFKSLRERLGSKNGI